MLVADLELLMARVVQFTQGRSRRAFLGQASVLCLSFAGVAEAQVIADAVQKATSVDAAFAAIGAKPEPSSHLLLDVPDVILPGKVRVRFSSEVAGTGWLVLLRGRKGVPPRPPEKGQVPEAVLLTAEPYAAGKRASGSKRVDIQRTEYLTLLAQSRGRWYFVEREIKVARSR
jgi:hypothetical protein